MKIVTRCQSCNSSELRHVLSLGYMPPVNMMVPVGAVQGPQTWLPTDLLFCNYCKLVQLGIVADKEWVFPMSYPYTSGTTKILRDNFADLQRECVYMFRLRDDLIVDVGSNDGTLLSYFQSDGQRAIGIEPTDVAKIAVRNGITTYQKFFNASIARQITRVYGRAKVVTMANVFAHIEDPNSVVDVVVNELLADDGAFVIENHYLHDMLRTRQYDTIYHEHLRYYSLRSLQELLTRHGLEIFYARRIPTHGGSIRVYAARNGAHHVRDDVHKMLDEEPDTWKALQVFRQDVAESKRLILESLISEKYGSRRIVGIGAPSRASTLVTYLGLDENIIDYVCEISGSLKIGRYMPGTKIPVVDERQLYEDQPECAVIFSWHIADEIASKLRDNGYEGKILVPLPTTPHEILSARIREIA
jgi:hypothetical protein